ncbi:Shikimate dehydrogenase [Rosistilla ulvae]|uniref:Multifunctional fusion protein n=2 Tax=Rosistilla ulvae TaxID=1930277 RepID=A0A517LWQ6_9BACT|nr:Shikimate dehydrogenase [Rosistilla ulvae]
MPGAATIAEIFVHIRQPLVRSVAMDSNGSDTVITSKIAPVTRFKSDFMICVSIGRGRHKRMIAEYEWIAQQGIKLVELRLDYLTRTVDLHRLLGDKHCQVIATCRRREDGGRWKGSEEDRLMLLRSAIASGVDYVDLEGDIAHTVPRYGRTKRIVSYHNFETTPDNLAELHSELARRDADVVKIATMANCVEDTFRMMELVKSSDVPTIGLCMGDLGTPTRILQGSWGSPLTFASIDSERTMAPGQVGWKEMLKVYDAENINADTKLFGVIADPVGHSYSPLIHNAGFKHQQLNNRYLPFRVPHEDLDFFMENCQRMGIKGLSVTIPHKEEVMEYLTEIEASAHEIGAVNTIVFDGDKRRGFNTDYRAAMDCLMESVEHDASSDEPLRGKTALLLGAGGVCRAIAWGLRQRGADIIVTGRSPARAEALAASVGGNAIAWEHRHDPEADILINGTPLGMYPNLDQSPYDGNQLRAETTVFETIYNPGQTLLVKLARQKGCKIVTGVDMFIRQAAYQYKLFTGKEPPISVMRQALARAVNPAQTWDATEAVNADQDGDDEES